MVFQCIIVSVKIIYYICISFISETILKIYQLDQIIYKIVHSDSWCFNYIYNRNIFTVFILICFKSSIIRFFLFFQKFQLSLGFSQLSLKYHQTITQLSPTITRKMKKRKSVSIIELFDTFLIICNVLML